MTTPLYGRNNAIARLSHACAQIHPGKPVWILIEGSAGIGKTSLVNYVRTTMQLSPTQYAAGKFEQFHRQMPYSALIAALRKLIETVLNLPSDERSDWQAGLRKIPRHRLAPLVEVLPDLALLLDEIAAPLPLPPKEAQLRLEAAFAGFISCFARSDHPLLLFLDDMQWADIATLRLLRSLGAEAALGNLIIAGTCRDNELTSLHPLTQALEALEQAQVPIARILLNPISTRDLEEWLSVAYGMSHAEVGEPARWLAEQSEGNPLFVGQLLNTLREKSVLQQDDRTQQWRWQADRLQEAKLAGNINSFMEDRLRELPQEQQTLLSQAACLGTQFGIEDLARIRQESAERISALLSKTTGARLVEPGPNNSWRFTHDRSQQAAYRLLPDAQRQAQHLQIGRLLLAGTAADGLDAACFDLTAQFNHAAHLLTVDERLQVADLNLRAGRRAKAAAAFEAALGYLRTGQALLPEDAWQNHYALTFELVREAAECAYATGDTALADQLFELALSHAQNRLDRASVYGIMVMFSLNAGRARDAWQLGGTCLAEFGIELGTDPALLEQAIVQAEPALRARLAEESVQQLMAQPLCLTAEQEAAGDLLLRLYVAGYQMGKQTYAYITMRMMEFALQTRHPGVLAFGLINFAVILIARHGAYAEADRHANTALQLARQLQDATLRARIDYVFGSMVAHWTQPIPVGLQALERCYEQAAMTADNVYIGLSLSFQFRAHILAGEAIPALCQFWEKAMPTIRQINSAPITAMFDMNRQWLRAWTGDTHAAAQLDSDDFDSALFRARLEALPAKSPYHWFALLQAILCYMHGQPAEAKTHMLEAESYLDAVAGQLSIPEHHFWRGLILHANGDQAALASSLALLEAWAATAPANFSHRASLLRAELHRAQGEQEAALAAYRAAISAARDSRHLLLLALALERQGEYFLALDLPLQGQAYLQESIAAYYLWGAPSKAHQLQARHPAQLPKLSAHKATGAAALQPAFNEIRLDRLLALLLPLLAQQVQASRTIAVIDRDGQLMVEAQHPPIPDAQDKRLPLPLEHAADYPASLIAEACRRKQLLALAQPSSHEKYGTSSCWQSHPAAAALCLPIKRHGRLLGAFYLERSHDDWPADAVHILEQLSEQLASALENALVYADLEQQIGERARAEKFAREGERRWRAFLEHAHMAVLCLDITGTIEYVNPFLQTLCGYAEDELVGRDWVRALLPAQYHALPLQEQLLANLHASGHCNGLTKVRTRSGDIRTIAWSNSLLRDPDGKPIGSISIGGDMTDQRRAERALRQLNLELEERVARRTAELAATNRELDAFAYSISHDLRAPLRSIDGFSQAIWEDCQQILDATAQDYLQRVLKAARRMDGMIDAMLNMSRQTRGELSLQKTDLSAMAQEVIDDLRHRHPERRVTTCVEPNVLVQADARLMRNVLDNLLENAWKYTVGAAEVTIRFEVTQQDGERVFCVADNGPGFDSARADKLFTAFHRLHTGGNIEGSGIGLATVQRIIHRHGGRIWAEAEPGKGAVFRFTLKDAD